MLVVLAACVLGSAPALAQSGDPAGFGEPTAAQRATMEQQAATEAAALAVLQTTLESYEELREIGYRLMIHAGENGRMDAVVMGMADHVRDLSHRSELLAVVAGHYGGLYALCAGSDDGACSGALADAERDYGRARTRLGASYAFVLDRAGEVERMLSSFGESPDADAFGMAVARLKGGLEASLSKVVGAGMDAGQ